MPNKRNRKDSESSSCSASGFPEEQHSNPELLPASGSGSEPGSDDMEVAWLRPCCTPLGCIAGGQVNLTEPDEIEKIACSNESCTSGCYMHKECFTRWEDGLLTYLRSHGRARSWSEKQRRQNLWTKRGYDLAFRACACVCGRGHLRKDLNWNPKDVTLPTGNSQSKIAEEAAKKKNRKKHKDLPTLGNKYTFGVARSKSKAIPASGKDNRVRTSSSSSCLSIDQGYSSSSPSNSEIHGPLGTGLFSPPQNSRGHLGNGARISSGYRNPMAHGANSHMFQHGALPQIPDNDVLNDFGPGNIPHLAFCDPSSSLFSSDYNNAMAHQMRGFGMPSPQAEEPKPFPLSHQQHDRQLQGMDKLMDDLSLSPRQPFDAWNFAMQTSPLQSPLAGNIGFDHDISAGVRLEGPVHPKVEGSRSFPGHTPLSSVLENPSMVNLGLPFIGHWNPSTPDREDLPCRPVGKGRTESLEKITEQPSSLPFRGFMENATTMLCSDIDLKKPKVVIIPGESVNHNGKKTCTEICITPMCSTTFHKRLNFSAFQNVLRPNQVNPYHIKMEGEGYGSDDFRNSVLTKLSRANCSEMNCVTCGKLLLIYDHFPLVDGTLFLSPLRNEDRNHNDLKIEIEHKNEYLHAVCVGCLNGANNLVCVMCESRWRVPFHQLGSLYMFDVFAAAPCCQRRLCCKRCGAGIVDRNVGLKYYSQYSAKARCPGCGEADYHFVHPASTFRVLGPQSFSFF